MMIRAQTGFVDARADDARADEESVSVARDVLYQVVAFGMAAVRYCRVSEEVLVSMHIWPRCVGRWLASRGKEV